GSCAFECEGGCRSSDAVAGSLHRAARRVEQYRRRWLGGSLRPRKRKRTPAADTDPRRVTVGDAGRDTVTDSHRGRDTATVTDPRRVALSHTDGVAKSN